jgi:zinc protease
MMLLFVFCQSLRAQTKLPDNMYVKHLGNGLEVLVLEDHSVPLATVDITCKNGSFTEPPPYNGLSHLYEHMFFNGKRSYESQSEFLSRLAELGITHNATTEYEKVEYYFTLPKKT